jgi:ribose transport system permease protein
LLGALALVVLVASIGLPESFGTWSNYQTILGAEGILLILALGVLMPLTVGDFDLSIGGTFSLGGIILGVLNAEHGWPLGLAIAAVVFVGLIVGLVNAALSVGLGVSSFVVTLGSGTVLSGLALALSHNSTVSGISPNLIHAISTRVFGIPMLFLLALAMVLILWYVFDNTPFGRHLFFVGGSPGVARLSGLRVGTIRTVAFMISGAVAACAGLLLAGQLGAANPEIGTSYLLPAYSAAFLSTTAVKLGRFNPWGTLIAVYFLAAGITAIELLGVESWVEQVFYGISLMTAISLASFAARTPGA